MTRIFLIMSIVASLLISVTACQKDLEKKTTNSISQEDLELSRKITSFIDKMNTPSTLKSGGIMDVDSALWNVEAAMNYSFADIPEQIEDVQLDSIEFVLAVDNGFCTESALTDLYQAMYAAIQKYCDALNEYQFMIANVTVGEQIAGAVGVKVYLVSGISVSSPWSFGSNDWWHSYHRGYCAGPYEGQGLDRQSATEIQKKVNASIPKLTHVSGCPIYFTDISTLIVPSFPTPNWDSISYPYRQFLTRYYYIFPVPVPATLIRVWPDNCLSPDDLNFFVTNNISMINSSTMKPAGKTLISVWGARADRWYDPMKLELWEDHTHLKADYGIPHVQPCNNY